MKWRVYCNLVCTNFILSFIPFTFSGREKEGQIERRSNPLSFKNLEGKNGESARKRGREKTFIDREEWKNRGQPVTPSVERIHGISIVSAVRKRKKEKYRSKNGSRLHRFIRPDKFAIDLPREGMGSLGVNARR